MPGLEIMKGVVPESTETNTEASQKKKIDRQPQEKPVPGNRSLCLHRNSADFWVKWEKSKPEN